jgi:soluble lytic murein transglycosylase-like protein
MKTPVRFLIPSLLIAFLVIILSTAHLASANFVIGFEQNKERTINVIEDIGTYEDAMIQENSSGCIISSQFPESVLQWCEWITISAQEVSIDANLIAAVIQVESAGVADAYSSNGAVGLMQVMPCDGLAANFLCINGPCFAERPTMNELFDPEFNIHYGSQLLKGYLQKNQNLRDGLLAYGPAGVGYSYADEVLRVYNEALNN